MRNLVTSAACEKVTVHQPGDAAFVFPTVCVQVERSVFAPVVPSTA